MKDSDLDEFLEKWRWLVPGVDVYHEFIDEPDDSCAGVSTAQIENNRHFITIYSLDECKPAWPIDKDYEQVYVHELLHWWFEQFRPKKRESAEYRAWESAIDWMARSLVHLDRRKGN